MYSWQDYLAKQLPVEWQVNAPYLVAEITNNLKGATPESTTLSLNPGPTAAQVEEAIQGHVKGSGELVGTFAR